LNLLLDTNVLLWWLDASPRLSSRMRTVIQESRVTYVSVVTIWEVGIKASVGKLEFHGDMERQLALNGFVALNITVTHAIAAGRLPRHHRDPFDRMLVAQAAIESLTLVTSDAALKAYDVPVILA
jgi:PIN domain nuclease of toxin-antitoxin system